MIYTVRIAALILLLVAATDTIAGPGDSENHGRSVASVLDEYRAQGYPFAYSSNLVDEALLVTVNPTSDEPLEIVRQILAPHGLDILEEHGFYLVVRSGPAEQKSGKLLLITREKTSWTPLVTTSVSARPELTAAIHLDSGVQQFSGLAPQKYRVLVEAEGYESRSSVVVVRQGETAVVEMILEPQPPELEVITVSSSRYDVWSDTTARPYFIDQRSLQQLPNLADDPLRAVQRLPGSAGGGVSAQTHFRGGEEREAGMVLNGYRLFEPFHVRDFQSIFSTVDPRSIEGVSVYTGGFPVRYGDEMSAIVVMDSLDSSAAARTELGLSVFNTSLLTAGNFADYRGNWLLSARRGNLDLIVRPEEGTPSYYDVFGELGFEITPSARLSGNFLLAEDRIEIILADDASELERASSDASNAQIWLRLQNQWSAELSSSTILSFNSFSNERLGDVNDPENVIAAIDDRRDVRRIGLQQDWRWSYSDLHYLGWGFEFAYGDADYRYRSDVSFFGLPARYPGIPANEMTDLTASPAGGAYALYVSDKWKLGASTFMEAGLRWDYQDYTGLAPDPQISPRLSLFHATRRGTEYRLSWGRYFQSHGIHELQIEDGVTEFTPAQRADHLIAGLRKPFGDDYALRLELFHKEMRRLRPRFENLFDPLALLPEIEPDRIRIAPAGARARGLEIMFDYEQDGPLSWWASYTLAEVTDDVDGEAALRSWDQTHAVQAGFTYSSPKWDVGIAAKWHSGWPTTDLYLLDSGMVEPGPRNGRRFASFATLDARVSRRFAIGDSTLTTFLELANATDRRNPCCVDYDLEIDDAGSASLVRQEENWLPLLPAIGFLWEF